MIPVIEIIEHHSSARGFSPHRLAHYVLDVAEMFDTDAVAANVLLVGDGHVAPNLRIGIRRRPCVSVDYYLCRLRDFNALDYLDSPNIAARIVLPNMGHPRERRVDVCASAVEGLGTLEEDPHRREKYADFIGAYAGVTRSERIKLDARVAAGPLRQVMTGLWALAEEDGRVKGVAQGEARGRAAAILRLLSRRGLAVSPAVETRIIECLDVATLDAWFDRAMTATSASAIFGQEARSS